MTSIQTFKKMLDWLYANTEANNQTDVARKAGMNEVSMSRILNGKVKSVKQETMRAVNAAYGNPFNPEWLRGESDIMLLADVKPSPTPPSLSSFAGAASAEAPSPASAAVPGASPSGLSPIAAALLAAKDETIAALRAQLSDKDRMLAAKDEVIATKDALISDLRQQIITLRTQAAIEKGVLIDGAAHTDQTDKQGRIYSPQPTTQKSEGHT